MRGVLTLSDEAASEETVKRVCAVVEAREDVDEAEGKGTWLLLDREM